MPQVISYTAPVALFLQKMPLRTVFDLTAEQKENPFTFRMPMRSPTKSDTGVLIRSITGKKNNTPSSSLLRQVSKM